MFFDPNGIQAGPLYTAWIGQEMAEEEVVQETAAQGPSRHACTRLCGLPSHDGTGLGFWKLIQRSKRGAKERG